MWQLASHAASGNLPEHWISSLTAVSVRLARLSACTGPGSIIEGGCSRVARQSCTAAMLLASSAVERLNLVLQIVTTYYNQVKASAEEDNSVWGIGDPSLGYE